MRIQASLITNGWLRWGRRLVELSFVCCVYLIRIKDKRVSLRESAAVKTHAVASNFTHQLPLSEFQQSILNFMLESHKLQPCLSCKHDIA
jgi:hypothetical protein